MDGLYSGVFTALMIIGFIGIWVWAWSSKRKSTFDKMSQLPLDDTIPEDDDKDRSQFAKQ